MEVITQTSDGIIAIQKTQSVDSRAAVLLKAQTPLQKELTLAAIKAGFAMHDRHTKRRPTRIDMYTVHCKQCQNGANAAAEPFADQLLDTSGSF